MSKLCFLTNNLIDTATLTLETGTVNAQFPLKNIKHDFTTKTFRSIGSSVSIVIDLGSTLPVDTIAICGDALTEKLGFNTALLKGSGSTDFSFSTAYPLDVSHKYNISFKQLPEASHRYWQLTLSGTDFVEISNIFLGKAVKLLNNDINTTSFAWDIADKVSIQKNDYNQYFINEYNKVQSFGGTIGLVNAEEYALLREISINHGKRKPLWFLLDPEDAMPIEDSKFEFSGYYRFTNDFKWKALTVGLYNVSLDFEEVI